MTRPFVSAYRLYRMPFGIFKANSLLFVHTVREFKMFFITEGFTSCNFFKKISREEAGRKIIITHDSKPHVRFPLNAVKQNYRSVTNDLLHVGGIVSSPSKPEFFKILFPLISLTNARLRVSFLYLIIIPGLTLLDPKAGAWQVTNILFCHAWRVKRAWQRNAHWPWVGKQRVLSWLRG